MELPAWLTHVLYIALSSNIDPYVESDQLTQADCVAWVSLPLIGLATKVVYGDHFVAQAGINIKPYVQLIEQRPSAQLVKADPQRMQKAVIEQARH